jgi:hypothetical protein
MVAAGKHNFNIAEFPAVYSFCNFLFTLSLITSIFLSGSAGKVMKSLNAFARCRSRKQLTNTKELKDNIFDGTHFQIFFQKTDYYTITDGLPCHEERFIRADSGKK